MFMRTVLCTTLCAAALAALPAVAALYKWTDENGRVVYGDTPPPGVKAERMSVAAPPVDPNAVREMAAKDAELRKRAQARADEEAKTEKAAADDKARQERCVQIRGRMQTLRSGVPVYRFNDAGEKVYFGDAERTKALAETERALRDSNCAPVTSAPSGTSTY